MDFLTKLMHSKQQAASETIKAPNARHIWIDACRFRRWQHQISDLSDISCRFSHVGNTKCQTLYPQTLATLNDQTYLIAGKFRYWRHQMSDMSDQRLLVQTLAALDVRHVWKSAAVFQTLATLNVRHIWSTLAISNVSGTGCQTCLKISGRFSDIGSTTCQTYLIHACNFRRLRHRMSDMSENQRQFFRHWQH